MAHPGGEASAHAGIVERGRGFGEVSAEHIANAVRVRTDPISGTGAPFTVTYTTQDANNNAVIYALSIHETDGTAHIVSINTSTGPTTIATRWIGGTAGDGFVLDMEETGWIYSPNMGDNLIISVATAGQVEGFVTWGEVPSRESTL